ncbi:aldehyde dehydrogenase family protein [Glycomyces harbinensis]|uniref:Succinate-semialdehyde dehydrogenase / glutarate-semialdehyde dehydrogenase n=1 Tax=Glycomyces harbinensis TaxID=58114 RepID=A0A1G6QVL3_9ACTN|nr:aldehyde dehydrogenase family protein [Glycomyces harbinensis]SDC96450.1 succinate-semialdehyde dehydrogenase / glutarate-semialdehyde dehydrogenase [Glycomyces harbinensis]
MTEADKQSLLFIDGRWRPAADGAADPIRDPATGEVIGTVARAGESDVEEALAAVDRGFAAWRQFAPEQRAGVLDAAASILRSRAEDIARTITAEQGKPLAEARSEVEQSAGYFDWYAEEAVRDLGRTWTEGDREFTVERRPVGPVAAFSAWNFPASLPARKIAPAIAAGCSILVKPAEEAPGAAAALVDALLDAGLPGTAIALVTGDAPQIARQVIGSPVIRKITLTGSIPVGRELVRLSAEHLQPLSLELGGHAPVIVLPGADVEAAANALAGAKFRNAGQVCISPTRFFVPHEDADSFAAHFAAAAGRLKVGPGDRDGTDVGPLANERRLAAVESLMEDLRETGARVLTGGRRVASLPGWFYEPTVVVDVHEDARILTEEPFGPIAPVLPYRSLDEAVRRANAVEQGLAAYVFGPEAQARQVAARLDAGMIGVNGTALAVAQAPFGGVKSSGYGREGGTEGIGEYTVAVYTQVAG